MLSRTPRAAHPIHESDSITGTLGIPPGDVTIRTDQNQLALVQRGYIWFVDVDDLKRNPAKICSLVSATILSLTGLFAVDAEVFQERFVGK